MGRPFSLFIVAAVAFAAWHVGSHIHQRQTLYRELASKSTVLLNALEFIGILSAHGDDPHANSAWLGSVESTLGALKDIVSSILPRAKQYAVGVNGCVDLVANALDVTAQLDVRGSDESTLAPHEVVDSLSSFGECFGHYFGHGSAAERFVADERVFKDIVDAAVSLPEGQYFVGGNAALMAEKFANGDVLMNEVMLGAIVGPRLSTLISDNIWVPEQMRAEEDDIHLILEYKKGEKWGGLAAPRANRFIISHDMTNAAMRAMERFADAVKTSSPDTIVVSGLHMLEGLPEDSRMARLDAVTATLADIRSFVDQTPPKGTDVPFIHLELASFADLGFLRSVVQRVLPIVDSIGLNEQELMAAHAALSDSERRGPIAGHASVGVSDALAAMTFLLDSFEAGRLSRVHMHSLPFHAVVQRRGLWSPAGVAVATGSLASTRQACGEESGELHTRLADVTLANTNVDVQWQPHRDAPAGLRATSAGLAVEAVEGPLEIAVAPVLVCRKPTRTVGLGDTISASALERTDKLRRRL